jgi:colanic acid/amylovoran biosynthesis glycosyltransferase
MKRSLTSVRVLHAVDSYLNLTENWIYPQVVSTPNTIGHVLAGRTNNLATFPLKRSALILDPPSWNEVFGIPRALNAVAGRVGWKSSFANLRIAAWRPDIMHAHFGPCAWRSLGLKRRHDVPLVTSFYGYDAWRLPETKPFWRQRYEELFAAGNSFLVEGPAMRKRLMEIGCPEHKILIHRIGVDLTLLPYQPQTFSDGLRVIMVGRFVEKKGLVDGLQACALARSRGVKLSVTIVGDGTDRIGQEIKEQLHAIANRPELSGAVQFTGFIPVEQTHVLLQRHNVFLCPSKHASNDDAEGGSPVVLTEAMALGLLCIGTRHCDIPEVIVDMRTGYLCNESDVEGMAHVLSSAAGVPERLVNLTCAGRRHVEQNFSLSTQLEKARMHYGSLLSSNGQEAFNAVVPVLRGVSASVSSLNQ